MSYITIKLNGSVMAFNFKAGGLLLLLVIMITGCSGKSGAPSPGLQQKTIPSMTAGEAKIRKATFYIENSESMFGYVTHISEYVDVLAELAEKPDFVKNKVPLEFNFINGTAPTVTPLGNNPGVLRNRLNREGFNCGDITKSNLNAMFHVALKNAVNGAVSILISDGIYDIGGNGVTSLVTEGRGTRTQFINRLMSGDLQTIIVKLRSQFDGDYFYASKPGKIKIQGTRPYYLWIFGDSKLLNVYFPNEYISGKLKGFENMARFMKPGTSVIPYQVTADQSIGTFKFDHHTLNRLNDAKSDSHGMGFQFSIAVDYSRLPYPETYLVSAGNYRISERYSIVSIKKPTSRIHSVSFIPTHLITVKTTKSPAGLLTLSLINTIPDWIPATGTDSEDNTGLDKIHTYGFSYLTNGIIQAYESVSEDKSVASFVIDIH